MSLTFNGTEITSGFDLTYNGTHLTHVYFAETPNDTPVLVWAKEPNTVSWTVSVASASGGATLDYNKVYVSGASSCVEHSGADYRIANRNAPVYTTSHTGNAYYGQSDMSGGSTHFDGVIYSSEATAEAAAKRQIESTATYTYTYTALSYFNYTVNFTFNKSYAGTYTVKLYVGDTLQKEETLTTLNQTVSWTYKHYPTLENKASTTAFKMEIYDANDVLVTTYNHNFTNGSTTYGV